MHTSLSLSLPPPLPPLLFLSLTHIHTHPLGMPTIHLLLFIFLVVIIITSHFVQICVFSILFVSQLVHGNGLWTQIPYYLITFSNQSCLCSYKVLYVTSKQLIKPCQDFSFEFQCVWICTLRKDDAHHNEDNEDRIIRF